MIEKKRTFQFQISGMKDVCPACGTKLIDGVLRSFETLCEHVSCTADEANYPKRPTLECPNIFCILNGSAFWDLIEGGYFSTNRAGSYWYCINSHKASLAPWNQEFGVEHWGLTDGWGWWYNFKRLFSKSPYKSCWYWSQRRWANLMQIDRQFVYVLLGLTFLCGMLVRGW